MVSTPNVPSPPPRPGRPWKPREPDPEPGPTGPKVRRHEHAMDELRAIAEQTMRRWPDRREEE